MDGNGQALWSSGGISVGLQIRPGFSMAADGAGGAIVAWVGRGVDSCCSNVLTQRVDANGQNLWEANGLRIGDAGIQQLNPNVVSDGVEGAIIVWADLRFRQVGDRGGCHHAFGECDIYAQRVSATGETVWRANGLPITTAPENQRAPRLVEDGAGGAIIAWQDCRDYPERDPCIFNKDIYAQRVNANGLVLGQLDGNPVSTAFGNQGVDYGFGDVSPFVMTSDDAGGAILTWPDGRNGVCFPTVVLTECDVYAQRVSRQFTPTDLTVSVFTTRASFSSTDEFAASAGVVNPGLSSFVDFYFGALLPDGDTIVFFTDPAFNFAEGSLSDVSTLSPMARGVELSTPFIVDEPSFFSFTWSEGEAPGVYVMFLAAVQPGAFADGTVEPGDIVALSTAEFTFTP